MACAQGNLPRQPHQGAAACNQAAPHFGNADGRLARHHADIGAERHLGAAGQSVAVDGRNDGLEEIGPAQDGGRRAAAGRRRSVLPTRPRVRGVRIISGMVVPRSPPAEKAWSPAPVSSTTRMLGSMATDFQISTSRTIISGEKALRFSGPVQRHGGDAIGGLKQDVGRFP